MGEKPAVGEIWRSKGLWEGESEADVRIMEILPSGNVDVNYELDPAKPEDLRILPPYENTRYSQERWLRLDAALDNLDRAIHEALGETK